jgi:methyl-accepting chemotaxis protein
MPIDEQKLRGILAEQEENFKRHAGLLAEETHRKIEETNNKIEVAQEGTKRHAGALVEDTKRHVGVLIEETDRKLDLVLEGHQGLSDKMNQIGKDIAGIRTEIEDIRLHLFRKADLERLEALEQRVTTLEKRFPGR